MALDPSISAVSSEYDVAAVATEFVGDGHSAACAHGNGHINDTFLVRHTASSDRAPSPFILQRINTEVFRRPVELMDNVQRVTRHVAEKLAASGADQLHRRVLTLIPAMNGEFHVTDAAGNFWRAYHFIDAARTYDTVENEGQAFQVARAFGQFQRQLLDLGGPVLTDTIPGFHDAESRFKIFQATVEADTAGRVQDCLAEIEFVRDQETLVHVLADLHRNGELPSRITHNDTKINNVLLDETTQEALCVLDLDTVMPGLVHYDFGDMVRTLTCLAPEDATDLGSVHLERPLFEAVARGYLEGTDGFLTPTEKDYLAFSGKLMTFVIGLRFFTDHLDGDRYFKVHYDNQNLVRARAQFQLVRSIAEQEAELAEFIARA